MPETIISRSTKQITLTEDEFYTVISAVEIAVDEGMGGSEPAIETAHEKLVELYLATKPEHWK